MELTQKKMEITQKKKIQITQKTKWNSRKNKGNHAKKMEITQKMEKTLDIRNDELSSRTFRSWW